MKRIISLFLAAALILCALTGCAPKQPQSEPEPGAELALKQTRYSDYETDDNNRVFYEIFVGSF